MDIIDGQLHEPGMQRYWDAMPVEAQHAALDDAMHAQLRAVGVDGAVLHPIEDASWAHGLAASAPDRFVVVRLVAPAAPGLQRWDAIDPDAPDVEARLDSARAEPGAAAVRLLALSARDLPFGRGTGSERVLRWCADRSVPVLSPFAGTPAVAGEVARAFPDLPVVLDHLGLGGAERSGDPWMQLLDVLALASLPNVWLKLTGLVGLVGTAGPVSAVQAKIRVVLDRFGADRCFWGSDISLVQGQVGWANRFPALVGDYAGKHTYAQSVAFWRDGEWLAAMSVRGCWRDRAHALLAPGA